MGVASHEQFTHPDGFENIASSLGGTMLLFQNNFTPTPASVLSDFTEADFSGHTSQNVNDIEAGNTVLNRHEKVTQNVFFTHNGGGVANTIYGWYLIGFSAADNNGIITSEVIAYERFASPINMSVEGDRIDVQIEAIIEMLP